MNLKQILNLVFCPVGWVKNMITASSCWRVNHHQKEATCLLHLCLIVDLHKPNICLPFWFLFKSHMSDILTHSNQAYINFLDSCTNQNYIHYFKCFKLHFWLLCKLDLYLYLCFSLSCKPALCLPFWLLFIPYLYLPFWLSYKLNLFQLNWYLPFSVSCKPDLPFWLSYKPKIYLSSSLVLKPNLWLPFWLLFKRNLYLAF